MKSLFRLFVISLGFSLCFLTSCSNSTLSEKIDGFWYNVDNCDAISISGKKGIRAFYYSPNSKQPSYSTIKSLFDGIDDNDEAVQLFAVTPKAMHDGKKPSDSISDSCWNLVKDIFETGLEKQKSLDKEDRSEFYYVGCYGSMSGETETILLLVTQQETSELWGIRFDLLEDEYMDYHFKKID